MATPTLSTITPSSSEPAAGELVKIEGSGYNIPAIPVPTAQAPGVKVWFNGRECDTVMPVTSSIIYAVVPRYLGNPGDLPDTVDVRIANLDANGDVVVGEDETFADAFTYAVDGVRAPASMPFFILAIREAINEFKRQTGLDVVFGVHPDYQDEVELEYFEAEPPVIGIRDINASDYPYRNLYGREAVSVGADEVTLHRDVEEAEFTLEAVLVCDNKDELFRYYNAVRKMGQRTKYLYVPEDETTPETRANVKFRLDLDGDMSLNYRQVLASMSFTATIGPCPIEDPEIVGRAWEATTLVYDLRNSL